MAPITPPRLLLSHFVNDFTKRMTIHWRILFASRSFKGQQWLPIRRQKKIFKPAIRNKASTNFFYDLSGNDIHARSMRKLVRTSFFIAPAIRLYILH
ncbi:hypothetical protein AX14_009867 [Amanita brunnescens Koide BX004]|nr:hypothetical protein AX14_009867 [Amanita brunnescens Koide BX004]